MKKIIMTLAIAASSLFAFAGDEVGHVSKHVLNSFNKEFATAEEVKWIAGIDYYKASFILNDQYISAFYNLEGGLFGMTRNISSVNLPLKLQTKLRSDYSAFWISDLFELSDTEGTHYFMTIENADSKVILRSIDNTEWSVFKKAAKS